MITFKSLILSVLLFLLANTTVSSQINFGLNAGLNLSSLSSDSNYDRWDYGMGFRIGGIAEKTFGKFGLRLETDYSFVEVKGDFHDKIQLHYISIPLTLTYKPIDWLKLYVGPELNVLLNQRGPKYHGTFGDDDFENFDYGAHIALEFRITERLGIYGRNYFGLQFNGEIPSINGSETVNLDRLNISSMGINYYLVKSQP